jgi:hypothetical protein
MTPQQIAARIRRLEFLAMGLRQEHQTVGESGVLNLDELSQYQEAIRRAASALEAARVPLERALRRHREASLAALQALRRRRRCR